MRIASKGYSAKGEPRFDLSGHHFGKLTAIRPTGESTEKNGVKWECHCSCGNTIITGSSNLMRNRTRSCGCSRGQLMGNKVNLRRVSPGTMRTWQSWNDMRRRCENVGNKHYPMYGGAGITVCKRWRTFSNFLADMGVRSKGYVLDRIKNWRGYTPSNCRWATTKESTLNRRSTKFVRIGALRLCVNDWCTRIGVHATNVRAAAKTKQISLRKAILQAAKRRGIEIRGGT